MGARQSYLYVYLKEKDKECSQNGCDITPSKKLVSGSIDFEVVTYTFNYNGKAPTGFDIYLYDSKGGVSDSSYIFGYCSPRVNQVAKRVEVYYSVLAPDNPLVVSFVTDGTDPYKCEFNSLRYARWDWASNITEYTFTGGLVAKLKEQYRNLNLNKTIKLAVGDESTNDVEVIQHEIDKGKKKYRIIYKPKGQKSVLNCNCIFNHNETIDISKHLEKNGCKEHTAKDTKKLIDPYCLTSVKDHFFDGIIVYYEKESENKYTALYMEFIDLRDKDICLKRMDQEGCWWAEEKIEYNDNAGLEKQLSTIKTGLQKGNTVLLDAKATYTGVEVTNETSTKVYIKYIYKFKNNDNPLFLYARQKQQIGNFNNTFTTNTVHVYYLKARGKDDTEPFLIVFFSDGRAGNTKKAYHFKGNYGFEDWMEFNFEFKEPVPEGPGGDRERELLEKLKDKLKKIDKYCACLTELTTVRWYAHQILIDPEFKPPEPPPAKPPEKPKEERPPDEPKPLPVWLIVGCVAAGVVLIVTSVVVYGIYWYNTTIKLLT
ncbi:conserved hypothetical protein [Theileria orientalis strain Shintoku]|uniref:Uncharacterized protein n=1 Tax=Theileria orientalis strain Shintoku TaxID=869250 RepID=J4D9M9_THEOR|nr:conserved hypothetical protein [Theileria orientalis strain Shintoku]BAM41490.1 conserved hypothetical protein [Theileria orientalis strain Shintoku]|eukprot:XP_009691791.1 conserved hypothetical protein [Theileria orientalis strain Shintoku]